MNHVHFFGCSYTAGDELTDDEVFPWKSECIDANDYYSRRKGKITDEYEPQNKKFAYPALLQSSEMLTFNYARNGAGVQENMMNLLDLVSANVQIDCVYFQISPFGRELVIDQTNSARTLQLYWDVRGYEKYLEAKRRSHKFLQYSIEDLVDLIMIHNYLSNRNIKHKFLELANWITDTRFNDLSDTKYSYLITEYKKLPRLNLSEHLERFPLLLGNHFSRQAHAEIARLIDLDLKGIAV
jgi:hypothetical protein